MFFQRKEEASGILGQEERRGIHSKNEEAAGASSFRYKLPALFLYSWTTRLREIPYSPRLCVPPVSCYSRMYNTMSSRKGDAIFSINEREYTVAEHALRTCQDNKQSP